MMTSAMFDALHQKKKKIKVGIKGERERKSSPSGHHQKGIDSVKRLAALLARWCT
jgi:hypothetical protein